LSFTTTAASPIPQVTTQAATSINSTGATLNASVNPEGTATTVQFVYGTSPTLASGTTTTSSQSIGSGTSAVAVTAPITGLTTGTKYYFEVKASNTGGPNTGSILSFTTNAVAPAVIQFASGQFTANVTNGVASIVIARSGNLSASVSVLLASAGGHDVPGFEQTVHFGANQTSATVSVPLSNDGVPGEADSSVGFSLSSPSAGAGLGNAAAILNVHDNNPYPAPVTVTSVSTPTFSIKTGSGKRAKTKKLTGLQIQFSGNIVSGATNGGAFSLKSGKTNKNGTTYTKNVGLSTFSYNANTFTLSIYPAKSLNLTLPEEIIITASALTDAYGRPLDGNHDGQPGGNFVATFSKKGVTIQ
jgi:hypothetical protein